MFFRKSLLISFLTIFALNKIEAKEFTSAAAYLKIFPAAIIDGKDGNWLKTDRQKNTPVWNRANEVNIKKDKGYQEYTSIAERSDFYVWFQHRTDSLGFETKWGYAAAITTKKLEKLLTNAASLCGITNSEIRIFVIDGNEIIFNDIWKELKSLYTAKPLKEKAAETWDGVLLLKEQQLIEPYYQKLSPASLAKLEKLLRKENFFSRLMPGYEFEGQLLNLKDRWYYGMKMMHYQHPEFPSR
ncbi:hypothetical protein ACS5PU_02055 [Pedobacter sp. GSP4]|uniref:hypothetical protein n=1 Tax=Pedobacter sp. GSP4 TaxID=3453716 RepID=UPI003EE874A2